MPAVVPGYEYDIFISYRQKDNKYDGWVTNFVADLKKELEATLKEDVSVYFDENPHDGIRETHLVDDSLKDKLRSLILIPIISQTYCDPKSFAWTNEFLIFKLLASQDKYGLKLKLSSGNVASRILPVRIHQLDEKDKALLEHEVGVLRAVDFTFSSSGVNRPLTPSDKREENINKTLYRDQVNKVANAIKEILFTLQGADFRPTEKHSTVDAPHAKPPTHRTFPGKKPLIAVVVLLVFLLGYLFIKPQYSAPVYGNAILVLPFSTDYKDSIQQYFADGITSDIITEIGKVRELSPLSWRTSFNYRDTDKELGQIASETKASYILSGNIQRSSDKIRVNVELANPLDNKIIWASSFDKAPRLILDLQKEIAIKVAGALRIKLSEKERTEISTYQTSNFEAYDLFLQAQAESRNIKLNPNYLQRSQALLEKAIKIDSTFAQAYILWAFNFIDLSYYEGLDPVATGLKAKGALQKALELQPNLPDSYIVLGGVNFFLEWNMEEAKVNFDKGWKLSGKGNSVMQHCMCTYSEFLLALGDYAGSLSIVNAVLKRDQFYPFAEVESFMAYQALHDIPAMKKIQLAGKPEFYVPVYDYALGDYEESIRRFPKESPFIFPSTHLASVYYKAGYREKSDSLLNMLIRRSERERNVDYIISVVYAARGQKEESLRWYQRAYTKRDFWIVYTRVTPELELIIHEPEVKTILQKIGL